MKFDLIFLRLIFIRNRSIDVLENISASNNWPT